MTLAVAERTGTVEQGYAITERGLVVTRTLTEPEWADLGRSLTRRHEGSCWALGDWLMYGGRQGKGGRWIGSSYRLARRITGYSGSHLSSLHNVAQAYAPAHRGLAPWSLYRDVLPFMLKRRLELLTLARDKGWTSQDLKQHLIGLQPPRLAGTRKGPYVPAHVKCPSCAHVFPFKPHRVASPVDLPKEQPCHD
jgi:hypothetical protein